MKLYAINKWGELFENNRSRTVKDLDWVSIPNKHDGENYSKIVAHPEGAEIFAGWNLIVQVASKCRPRGILVKDSGEPQTPASLSLKTRAPKSWFDKAFSFLEKNTDWLLVSEVPDGHQHPVSLPPDECEEGKGREGKEGKGNTGGFPKEVEFWNSNCGELPKVASMSDDRMKKLRARRQDSFWVANYEEAVKRVVRSDFCCGKNDRKWKSDFEWMLQPNVVAKIMEGKYDNRISSPSKNGNAPSRAQVVEYAKEKGDKSGFCLNWYDRWNASGFMRNGRPIDWKTEFSTAFAARRT
jgi:hypothetical protein